MKKPEGVLFDLGGTVLELLKYDSTAGDEQCLLQLNNPDSHTTEDMKKRADEINSVIHPARESSMLEFSDSSFRRLLYEEMNLTLADESIDLDLEYWKGATEFRPEPNIVEALEQLKALSIRMGIVSNCTSTGAVLEWELQRHGLLTYFEFVMSSADYGIRKPHPMLFDLAVTKLGIDRDRIWFLGDKPPFDIKGAKSAGLFSVWYNRGIEDAAGITPDAEVDDWDSFRELLAKAR